MTIRIIIFMSSLVTATQLQASDMQSLTDDELGNVSGKEGVLISMDYYLNTLKTSDLATSGNVDPSFCSGTLADTNCRFTWQIANRAEGNNHSGLTGAKGEWLVYKDGYASLTIDKLSLDASFLGGAVSSGAAYTSWFNPETFEDVDGNCLLTGGNGITDCSVAYIQNMPALRTHYPETSGSYNSGSKDTTGYNDVRLGMHVGGLAVEYNESGAPGYELNNRGSFAGLAISDNNGHQAGFAFGGSFYLYGF